MTNSQKGFSKILTITVLAISVAGTLYFLDRYTELSIFSRKDGPGLPPTAGWKTYSSNNVDSDYYNIRFKYPPNWIIGGKSQYGMGSVNLAPAGQFIPEATRNNISITIGGHCMNTQCLTVYNLDGMVNEFDAIVLNHEAKAKNITGYKIKAPDGRGGYVVGYIFIKDKTLVNIYTDNFEAVMDEIVPTLEIIK